MSRRPPLLLQSHGYSGVRHLGLVKGNGSSVRGRGEDDDRGRGRRGNLKFSQLWGVVRRLLNSL